MSTPDEAVRLMAATMQAADNNASLMARLLVGRLRLCNGYWLKKLKAELQAFDSRTQRWTS